MLKRKKLQKNTQYIEIGDYVISIDKIQYIKKYIKSYVNYTPVFAYKLYYGEPTMSYNKHTNVWRQHSENGSYESIYNVIELDEKQYNRLYQYINDKIIKL